MTLSYKVYWNNICLLSNMEEAFINTQQKIQKHFPFTFEYYGLGKPSSMTVKIKEDIQAGNIGGDIIVSTDLDIYQDVTIAKYLQNEFKKSSSLLPINEHLFNTTIPHPEQYFHPFVVIPLVMVVNSNLVKESEMPKAFEDLISPNFKYRYAFGGIHNSAGRSLLKSLWYMYGEKTVEKFLSDATITSMPAQAFQQVMTGQVEVAIVPTIFALRKGVNGIKAIWPKEGAIAIPSYVACKNSVSEEDFSLFVDNILGKEFQLQLKNAGDIIPSHPELSIPSFAMENDCKLLYPEWEFFKTFDHEEFYNQCNSFYHLLKAQ